MNFDPYLQFLCSPLLHQTQDYLQSSTNLHNSSHWTKLRAEVESAVKNIPGYLSQDSQMNSYSSSVTVLYFTKMLRTHGDSAKV